MKESQKKEVKKQKLWKKERPKRKQTFGSLIRFRIHMWCKRYKRVNGIQMILKIIFNTQMLWSHH